MEWLWPLGKGLAWLWHGFASAVEGLVRYWVRETNPRHAVALYVAINVLVTPGLTFFLTDSWSSFFTVTGYWATFTGLIVALVELYRARTVAEEIQEAVQQENARLRGFHYRHCLERAKLMLSSARDSVHAKQWTMAVVRLEDLTSYLSYVNSISPAADNRWRDHSQSVQRCIGQFSMGQNGRRCAYNDAEWRQLTLSILEQLDDELAPFQYGEGEGNDSK